MKLEIDKFLDRIDKWKFRVQKKLDKMTPAEEAAFWRRVREDARKLGLHVVEPPETKNAKHRIRRTG